MFASFEQVKGNVLKRQKQCIFKWWNLKTKGSAWFADLQPLQCLLVNEKQ